MPYTNRLVDHQVSDFVHQESCNIKEDDNLAYNFASKILVETTSKIWILILNLCSLRFGYIDLCILLSNFEYRTQTNFIYCGHVLIPTTHFHMTVIHLMRLQIHLLRSMRQKQVCNSIILMKVWGSMRIKMEILVIYVQKRHLQRKNILHQHKGEVSQYFLNFKTMVEKEKGVSIKCLRSDGGGEYFSNEFSEYLKEHGIQRKYSCSYSQ